MNLDRGNLLLLVSKSPEELAETFKSYEATGDSEVSDGIADDMLTIAVEVAGESRDLYHSIRTVTGINETMYLHQGRVFYEPTKFMDVEGFWRTVEELAGKLKTLHPFITEEMAEARWNTVLQRLRDSAVTKLEALLHGPYSTPDDYAAAIADDGSNYEGLAQLAIEEMGVVCEDLTDPEAIKQKAIDAVSNMAAELDIFVFGLQECDVSDMEPIE